jgi:hypothetical protein
MANSCKGQLSLKCAIEFLIFLLATVKAEPYPACGWSARYHVDKVTTILTTFFLAADRYFQRQAQEEMTPNRD